MELWQMRDLVHAALICLEAIPVEDEDQVEEAALGIRTAYDHLSVAAGFLEEAADAAENLEAEIAADDTSGDQSSG